MQGEDFYEEGVVLSAADGTAKVKVLKTGSCEECSAKMFCSTEENAENTLLVTDPLGVKAGDEVRILVKGVTILKAALLLYGIPLVLLLAGLIAGMNGLDPGLMAPQLWSFLLGLGLAGVYYLILYLFGLARGTSSSMMPGIISIKHPEAPEASA